MFLERALSASTFLIGVPVKGGLSTPLQRGRCLGHSPTPCCRCNLGKLQNLFESCYLKNKNRKNRYNRNKKEGSSCPPPQDMVRSNLRGAARPGDAKRPSWAPGPTCVRFRSLMVRCLFGMVRRVRTLTAQSAVPLGEAVAPGSLSEMQTLRPCPRPSEPESAL